jgi:serine/threonine protein kinase
MHDMFLAVSIYGHFSWAKQYGWRSGNVMLGLDPTIVPFGALKCCSIHLAIFMSFEEFNSKYELLRTLGSGAFSEVREARVLATDKRVAIKIIDRDKCKGKEDMIGTEVRILSMLDHPNIVKLYEKYEFGKKIYLVMEL